MKTQTRWQIIDTWNGGTQLPILRYVSRSTGEAGENECFKWIHEHTPFSFHEAITRQGYEVAPWMGRQQAQHTQRAA